MFKFQEKTNDKQQTKERSYVQGITVSFQDFDKTTTGGFSAVASIQTKQGIFFHPIQAVNGRAIVGKSLGEGLQGRGGVLVECANNRQEIELCLTGAYLPE